MSDDGTHMYCGTTSGDVLLVNINTCLLKQFGPQKDKYSQVIPYYLKVLEKLIQKLNIIYNNYILCDTTLNLSLSFESGLLY